MWNEVYENGHQKLARKFELDGFKSALDFVMKIAEVAEAQKHHPDILIEYNVVTIKSWTHDTGAVSERDKKLTSALNEVAKDILS